MINGITSLQYDGYEDNPGTDLDTLIGLGELDLTCDENSVDPVTDLCIEEFTEIVFDDISLLGLVDGGSVPIRVTVYSDEDSFSVLTQTLEANVTDGKIAFVFNDFLTDNDGADFTSVAAITVDITGDENSNLELIIGEIKSSTDWNTSNDKMGVNPGIKETAQFAGTTSVPEPATSTLFIVGLVGLGYLCRRQRAAA